jgi:thiol-disulfide isomerase/thioredoxin
LGRDEEAIQVYLAGTALFDREPILERLRPLWENVHGSAEGLDEAKAALAEKLADWEVEGKYEVPKEWNGRVVLAELFTGSECPPCVASDVAYDNLQSYYPTQVLAVLVYHEHIPAADPMTNPDTKARMDYYGSEIVGGTPTSIIDGDDYSVGGGPAAAASGRFGLYAWSIERALQAAPAVTLDLQASRRGRTVSARATVNPAKGVSLEGRRLRLRLALAEKVVHFTGGNGVAEHRMVVRSLLGGPDGIDVNVKGRTRTDQRLDLAAREQELLSYLNEYEQDPANANRLRNGGRFKEKTTTIADGGLVVVAFVQDEETREVLQTAIVAVR